MKLYITLLPMKTGGYRVAESVDYRFAAITKLFGYDFRSGELLAWLDDEKKESIGSEWINIEKERGKIVLYDLSPFFGDDSYSSINSMLEEAESFEMSVENFREVLQKWEELRTSRPDIILIVIHEDNHLSLEIDPSVIQQYQDAGYAFDSNKK